MTDRNRAAYESPHAVEAYRRARDLQPAEAAILDRFRDRLSAARMLDLGVGGGRTTWHFAPLVREYVGIDYSAPLIEDCRPRFRHMPNVELRVCDARDLSAFGDAAFDFILFSYNGLDYVDGDGRGRALAEIRRVLRRGGCFVFSSHNLQFAPELYKVRFSWSPLDLFFTIRRAIRVRRRNPPRAELAQRTDAILYDGGLDFTLATWYGRPDVQVHELLDLGFDAVDVYGFDGNVVPHPDLQRNRDPWLYYVCSG